MTNSALIRNLQGYWECKECGSDNARLRMICEFCETPRGFGLVARSLDGQGGPQRESARPEEGDGLEREEGEKEEQEAPDEEPSPSAEPSEVPKLVRAGKDPAAVEADQWAQERRRNLLLELRQLDRLSYAERRGRLRALQLELHPDKQACSHRQAHAQLLFLLVQAKWEQCERLAPPRSPPSTSAPSTASTETCEAKGRRPEGQAEEDSEEEDEAEKTSEPVEISVSDLGGEVCRMTADRSWLIWDVKREIEASCGLQPDRQRLLLDSKDLDDYASLKSLPKSPSLSLILVECLERYRLRSVFLQELKSSKLAWKALQYASASLRADKDLVMLCMEQDWRAWDFAAPELKADPALAEKVLSSNGLKLQGMSKKIRADASLVLKAVKQNWRALQFASAKLRRDAFVVLAALAQEVRAMEFAGEELTVDRTFAKSAVWIQGMSLKYFSADVRCDREVVRISCQKEPGAIAYAAPKLLADQSFMKSLKGNSEVPKCYAWNDEQRHQMEEELFDRYNYVTRA
ncbi:unnamed protein product [Durusdinium trenchii]|uniref:RanBP2-type domain-containing protein n=3 Tax=Durusdinium trenchii TaxID=1381693 RepID=A0ABP0RAM1_9DINO